MTLEGQLEGRVLGRDSGVLSLRDRLDNRLVAVHMTAQARRELCLFSRDLERPIYDQTEFLDNLKGLALRGGASRVRILLQDHDPAVKQGHRLIELARRLSSSIEIRIPPEDWLDHAENFLLADGIGYLHRENASSYEATADYFAPLAAQRLQHRFDEIWESSQVDSELRRLHI